MKDIEIEFDAFSGLPNPIWSLGPEQAERARDLFKALGESELGEPLYDGLGYRGLKVRGLLGHDEVTIRSGIVQADSGGQSQQWADKGRGLEKFLLETAQAHLDDQHALGAVRSVLREIGD